MEFIGCNGRPIPLDYNMVQCDEKKSMCKYMQLKAVHTLTEWNVRWESICEKTGKVCNGK